jgi:hypothetical protein
MLRAALVALIGISSSLAAYGQEIFMEKNFGGVRYETDTLILSSRDVLDILREEPLPYREFKLARKNYALAGVLGFSGGLLIALPVVSAIAGSQPEWILVGVGATLIVASIPLNRAFTRHAQYAIDTYNKTFASRLKTSFHFTGAGARLVIRF